MNNTALLPGMEQQVCSIGKECLSLYCSVLYKWITLLLSFRYPADSVSRTAAVFFLRGINDLVSYCCYPPFFDFKMNACL